MSVLRWCSLSWSWALLLLLGAPIAFLIGWKPTAGYGATATVAVVVGAYWHFLDVLAGGDLGERARGRRGLTYHVRVRLASRQIRNGQWVTEDGAAVGLDQTGRPVRVPMCGSRPAHGLACGATGSGKTVTMILIALAAIMSGLRRDRDRSEAGRLHAGAASGGGAARRSAAHPLVAEWRHGLQPLRARL